MKRKIITSLAAVTIAACTLTTASAAERLSSDSWCAYQQCDSLETQSQEIASALSEQEQSACDLINAYRRANGLSPLIINTNLSLKARVKSQDMKTNRYFSHNSPTYGTPFQMMKQFGITFQSAGENIAMGYRTAQAAVHAWMASESHRANILSTRYTTMGIGYVDGYWTHWFIR